LAYVIDNDVPKLFKADSARLQQIVVSLLNYSVKLMTSGEIVITVSANRTVSLSPSLTTLPLIEEPPPSEEEYSLTDPQSEDQGPSSDEEKENEKEEKGDEDEDEERRAEPKLDDELVELHFQVKISKLLISEEECNMLFKPFSSHSAASQFRQMGGAGLGTRSPLIPLTSLSLPPPPITPSAHQLTCDCCFTPLTLQMAA
jgi:signal transduction histidine kinase